MATLGRQEIHLDLFTDSYRVTGKVRKGATGLIVLLEDTHASFLELEQLYISRINQPGEIVANHAFGSVRKENINFIVLQDRRDGLSSAQLRSASIPNRIAPVLITVPVFEIHGDVESDGHNSPMDVLGRSRSRFQPIFNARASASLYPDIAYSGDLMFVHKERIGLFCFQDKDKGGRK